MWPPRNTRSWSSRTCTSWCRPIARRFTALHAAFRTGGTFLYVPADVAIELPLQTLTYLDAEGAAVFPHTLLIAERGAEVTFIDRYTSPDLGRAFSDAVVEIVVGDGAHVRYASIQEWGTGMTHLSVQRARVGRDADFRSLSVGFGASLVARRGRDHPGRARRVLRDARGVLRRRGSALRPPVRAGPRGAELHQRPAVQGRPARCEPRGLQRLGPRAPRRAEDDRDADLAQHRAVRAREGRCDPQPRDRGERRAMRPRRQRRPGRGGHALLPGEPWHPARRGRTAGRDRVLPGGPRSRHARGGPSRRGAGDPGRAGKVRS